MSPPPINVILADTQRQSDSKLGFDNLCKAVPHKKCVLVGDDAGGDERGERKNESEKREEEKKRENK